MKEELKPNIKKSSLAERLTTYLFYASVFIFFVAFNFRDSRTGGWYQQWLPNLNGRSISDIMFVDSLIGFAVTPNAIINDTGYILKTTNGGDNWAINSIYPQYHGFNRVKFINVNTGFVAGSALLKTTNSGLNWTAIPTPNNIPCSDISLINVDTFYICNTVAFDGGLFYTSNGGASWTRLFYATSSNPSRIYMYNERIGFMMTNDNQTLKTTNGGNNWIQSIAEPYTDIYFVDSLVGWKANGYIKKTTNGGINWLSQTIPQTNWTTSLEKFSYSKNDTIWGVGGIIQFPNYNRRGIIYRTTNGGVNWGYQIPDTSFGIQAYSLIDFVDRYKGWAYVTQYGGTTGIHTKIGGNDSTIFTNIKEQIANVSSYFELKQNYPNPYNNSSLIEYYVNETGWVKLRIYDISGKEMGTLVNEEQNTGGYGVPVSIPLSSGVYFYKMVYVNRKGEMQMDTKKMVVIK